MTPWLQKNTPFPPESLWLDSNGLICAGGDLSPARLLSAYQQGIFPWFGPDDPILWWSLDPRMVLFPDEFRLHRSLKKVLRRGSYSVRLDGDFEMVISACARSPRPGQNGSWISPAMIAAYTRLYELGFAHCVEVFAENELIGGLYGVALGGVFFGESMFAWQTDASKIALAHLVRFLDEHQFGLIDCQMNTPHLAFHGAREVPRSEFLGRVRRLIGDTLQPASWGTQPIFFDWTGHWPEKRNAPDL